jgi:hypothetical protein
VRNSNWESGQKFFKTWLVSDYVKHGINKFDFPQRRTCLHFACNFGDRLDTIDFLLKAGADVNARDKNRETPLVLFGPEVGVEEFRKNLTGISRAFDRRLHVFLIISVGRSSEFPKSILNAHFGHRFMPSGQVILPRWNCF